MPSETTTSGQDKILCRHAAPSTQDKEQLSLVLPAEPSLLGTSQNQEFMALWQEHTWSQALTKASTTGESCLQEEPSTEPRGQSNTSLQSKMKECCFL